MKGTSLVVSIILFVAIAALYVIHFTSGNGNEPVVAQQTSQKASGGLTIAYVKTDSLILNYDLAQDLHDDFSKKQEAYTSEYSSKRSAFEKEASQFQERLQRGGFLTEQRAVQERDKLVAKEQDIARLEQDLTSKLANIQAENNQKLLDSIINYLKKYNQDKKYDYILNAGDILIGDESCNITSEVLKALNEEYQISKSNASN